MGLFDHIINDESSTSAVANPPTQWSGTSGQDDSVLIIDDTPMTSSQKEQSFAMFPEEAAQKIVDTPMTAEDLIVFDDTPAAEIPSSTVSSVIMEESVVSPVEIKDETSELSNLLAQANEETEKQAPSFFASETVTMPVAEVKIPEISLQDEIFTAPVATPIIEKTQEVKPLEDPNTILDTTIAQLESLNANHDLVRKGKESEIEAKNQTIAELNKQVATLKKEITGINKEIDKIDSDKSRVNDMIKLFQSQKAA